MSIKSQEDSSTYRKYLKTSVSNTIVSQRFREFALSKCSAASVDQPAHTLLLQLCIDRQIMFQAYLGDDGAHKFQDKVCLHFSRS